MGSESINQTSRVKSSAIPQALIQWPDGLESAPVVLPIGETFEQSEEIHHLLERALRREGGER